MKIATPAFLPPCIDTLEKSAYMYIHIGDSLISEFSELYRCFYSVGNAIKLNANINIKVTI